VYLCFSYYIQTETQKHEPLLYIDRNTNHYYIQTETQTNIIYREKHKYTNTIGLCFCLYIIVVRVFVFLSVYNIGLCFCLYIIVVRVLHKPILYTERNTNTQTTIIYRQKHKPILYTERNTKTRTTIIYVYTIGLCFCLYIILVRVFVFLSVYTIGLCLGVFSICRYYCW
jgi:beta-lactamase regulating signal transducer with metallopeptidase domain